MHQIYLMNTKKNSRMAKVENFCKHGNFMMSQVKIVELKYRILGILEIKCKHVIFFWMSLRAYWAQEGKNIVKSGREKDLNQIDLVAMTGETKLNYRKYEYIKSWKINLKRKYWFLKY